MPSAVVWLSTEAAANSINGHISSAAARSPWKRRNFAKP